MARNQDGSLMTKEQEKELNIKRFNEALAAGNLYNTGPITDGGTSFSPERWDEYFKKNEDVKPEGYTNQKDIQTKLDAGENVTEELFGYETLDIPEEYPMGSKDSEGNITYEYKGEPVDEAGEPTTETETTQSRNLKGSRDKDGNLMAQEIAQDEATEKAIEADTYADEDEFDTTVEGWVKQFKQLSEEEFRAINDRDLKELGLNAVNAYYEVLDIHDEADDREAASLERVFDWQGKAKGAPTDAERDALVKADRDREDAEADAQLEDAESERVMMEADADADKLDAAYEANTFPMMGMSDKDKGMFTFKKTESKDDKNIQAGIGVITQDTGMNEEQARQLMTKLKGICG